MAKNHTSKVPLAPAKTLHSEDPTTILMPSSTYYNQHSLYPNKSNHQRSNNSKCLVYILAIFVLLCLTLLVFATIVVRVKPLNVTIASVSIKSLKYDNSPSFEVNMHMDILVSNRNFGHVDFGDQMNNMVTLFYGKDMSVVGDAKLRFKEGRVASRGGEKTRVEMKASSSFRNGSLLKTDYVRGMLNDDINSGYLELMGFATLKGKVHLLKNKLTRPTVAVMNCTIGIDLRRQLVHKLEC